MRLRNQIFIVIVILIIIGLFWWSTVSPAQRKINIGNRELRAGNYDYAISLFTEAIELEPNNAEAFYYRGFTYTHFKKDPESGIQDYSKAISLDPAYADAYDGRGVAYYLIGQYDLAIEDFTKAIELNPNSPELYNERGLTYADSGESAKAIQDFEYYLKLVPDSEYRERILNLMEELKSK